MLFVKVKLKAELEMLIPLGSMDREEAESRLDDEAKTTLSEEVKKGVMESVDKSVKLLAWEAASEIVEA